MKSRKKNTDNNAAFRPGSEGVCEAQLWESESQLVAVESLDQALKYMRRRRDDFIINKAESLGMISLLSGLPLD